MTEVPSLCGPESYVQNALSAVGLDFHLDRGAADGALAERSRALEATAVMPTRNQRAVDLGIHAYLETKDSDMQQKPAKSGQHHQHPPHKG